ncbi:MAG TPA: zinc ribbon domain-containing protein [Anaerolineales bacterium]|nr:zinc ribbon domain-containing protein [Anaerolineales bacterium]
MARRRTLGYVQNEWVCPNCSTRNKGGIKTCENCGAPQPENVQFELPSEQNLVKDEKQIQAAKAGADIHCGFCGTRNPATAETCSQCGGDLKEGEAREAGRVMQRPAGQPKIVKCDNCGIENSSSNAVCSNCGSPLPKLSTAPAVLTGQKPMSGVSPAAPLTAKKSSRNTLLVVGAVLACLAVICIGVLSIFAPTSSVQATVVDVQWQTNVPVQEIRTVNYSNERGSPPSDAYDVSCYDDSREVCEQRTIDRGNGFSEVVEECRTETDTYCSYTVDEWRTIQTYPLEGNDLRPVYDNPNLRNDQRIGDQSETLTVFFTTEDGTQESYTPDSITEFQQFTLGSTWTLNMNLAGSVVSVEP